jgi:hypothetical protein
MNPRREPLSEAGSRLPSSNQPTTDRRGFWLHHGWKFLLGLVLVIGLFGVGDLLRGMDADPAIPVGITGMSPDDIRATSAPLARLLDLQIRSGGLQLMVISLVWGVIILVPFRRGERWAWYAMWSFPLWAVAVAASFLFVDLQRGVPPPPPAVSGWVLFGIAALLLLASRRGFGPTHGLDAETEW